MYPPPNPRPFIGASRSGSGPLPQPLHGAHPGTEAPGAAGRQPAQAPLFLFWGPALPVVPWPVGWPGRGKRHTTAPAKMARVKCTAPPLFLLGGAALAFCPCLLRQGAHPEGTGPLPWPVGPAGPRAGLARRQSDAAQLGPLYDGGAKLGRLLKRGRGAAGSPYGAVPALGRKRRPLGWRPGALRGRGACGHGPHLQRLLSPVALLGAPL